MIFQTQCGKFLSSLSVAACRRGGKQVPALYLLSASFRVSCRFVRCRKLSRAFPGSNNQANTWGENMLKDFRWALIKFFFSKRSRRSIGRWCKSGTRKFVSNWHETRKEQLWCFLNWFMLCYGILYYVCRSIPRMCFNMVLCLNGRRLKTCCFSQKLEPGLVVCASKWMRERAKIFSFRMFVEGLR